MARDFKAKYHGNAYRSALYAAMERIAREQLVALVAAARLPLQVCELGIGVGKTGIVEGFSNTLTRLDFAVVRPADRAVVCLVEATGDEEPDTLARILSEKLEKIEEIALKLRLPVFVMYMKRSRYGTIKSVRFFDTHTLLTAYRFGCDALCWIDIWKEDEKPYLFIDLKMSITQRQFQSRLKKLVKGIGKEIPIVKLEELLRR